MLLRSSINGHQKSEVSYKNWLKAEGEEEKRLVYLLRRSYTIGRQKNGVKWFCSKNWLKDEGEEEKRFIDLLRRR